MLILRQRRLISLLQIRNMYRNMLYAIHYVPSFRRPSVCSNCIHALCVNHMFKVNSHPRAIYCFYFQRKNNTFITYDINGKQFNNNFCIMKQNQNFFFMIYMWFIGSYRQLIWFIYRRIYLLSKPPPQNYSLFLIFFPLYRLKLTSLQPFRLQQA